MPGLLWLRYFWRRDVYEPEPLALIARAFLLGALAFFPAFALERALEGATEAWWWARGPGSPVAGPLAWAALQGFVVVAPVEELLKLLVVVVFFYRQSEFDEPMDGIVYCVSCALGFATIENLSYMFRFGSMVLVLRMVFCCFLHAACSGLAGYYLGRAKFAAPGAGAPLVATGLALAWALHGLYDAIVCSGHFLALLLVVLLLWWTQRFLDRNIDDALDQSPFRTSQEAG